MNKQQQNRTAIILLRILFTILLVGSVVFIFHNSLEVAEVSGDRSEQVQQTINQTAEKVGMGPYTLNVIRKMAHFAEFLAMGACMQFCIWSYMGRGRRFLGWQLWAGLLTAVLDETIQRYVPGRSSSTLDVLIDFSGVICGMAAAGLLIVLIQLGYDRTIKKSKE